MSNRRSKQGLRAAWLLIPLFVLAACGRSICWCTDMGPDRDADTGSERVAACHGCEEGAGRPAPDTEQRGSGPCAPGSDCCGETGTMAAQAPQSSVFDQQAAGALVAAPLARELPPFPDVRAGRFLPRPPADRSPPLFVVNCSFRC